MQSASLANLNKAEPFDIYIGRRRNLPLHFGNPFVIGKHGTREECVQYYEEWLRGTAFELIEQDRRKWILSVIDQLDGHVLGCYCSPLICHGQVLIKLIEERKDARRHTTNNIQGSCGDRPLLTESTT